MLAINFNPEDEDFEKFIAYSRSLQDAKSLERIKMLQEVGIPVTMEKARKIFPQSRVGQLNIFITMSLDPDCRKVMEEQLPGVGFYERNQHYVGKYGITSGLGDIGVDE